MAWVQRVMNQAGSGTSLGVTINYTSGNCGIVQFGMSEPLSTLSDGVNTYVQNAVVGVLSNGGIFDNCSEYYDANLTGGSVTVTITPTSNSTLVMVANELSGRDTTAPLGETATGVNTGTTHTTDTTGTTTAGSDLLGCGVTDWVFHSVAAPWTDRTDQFNMQGASQENVASGTYSYTYEDSSSAASAHWISEWKIPASGSTTFRFLSLLGCGT